MDERDPRINARFMTFQKYLVILAIVSIVCGSNVGLYFLLVGTPSAIVSDTEDTIRMIFIMLIYLLGITFVVCHAVNSYRSKILMGPTNKLCHAAQRVASGDYSVRLAPSRTDGKKDEFEVLFEDFNVMTEELASTEMMKNDFVSNVSHELKTPLSVISNTATILESDDLTEAERKNYCEKIGEAARRLSVLVTNILQVNRLEHQKIQPKKKPFNLSEAIARCILIYDEKFEEKKIDLDTDLDENLIVVNDENLLDMVWTNLISNAIKFTPEGGNIRISLRRESKRASISVIDSGCGISAEDQRRIFDKFYQADTSRATQGNGLGLALVRRILELLGGTISLDSAPGHGSAFTVLLPAETDFPCE